MGSGRAKSQALNRCVVMWGGFVTPLELTTKRMSYLQWRQAVVNLVLTRVLDVQSAGVRLLCVFKVPCMVLSSPSLRGLNNFFHNRFGKHIMKQATAERT